MIEVGLVKLFRVTGNTKYLDTAKFFIDERGKHVGAPLIEVVVGPSVSRP